MPVAEEGGGSWGRSRGREAAAGINAVEGYLLWQAETSRAQERARRFADGLAWLTTSQRAEVERAYARDHLDHAEAALRATAERIAQLRAEYGDAYRTLSRRLIATFLLAIAMLVTLAALIPAIG